MTTEFKPRGFAKSAKDYNPDRSSWTDSPAEKQRKFLESQNQKAAGLPKAAPKEEEPELTSRDIEQARLAAAFNKARGPSLIDSFTRDYAGSKAMNDDDASKRGFDRDKDLVARRVDPKLRSKMIDESRQLDSRFGKGRYL